MSARTPRRKVDPRQGSGDINYQPTVAISDVFIFICFSIGSRLSYLAGDDFAAVGYGIVGFSGFLGIIRWLVIPPYAQWKGLNEEFAFLGGFVGLPLVGYKAFASIPFCREALLSCPWCVVRGESSLIMNYILTVILCQVILTGLFPRNKEGDTKVVQGINMMCYERSMGVLNFFFFAVPWLWVCGSAVSKVGIYSLPGLRLVSVLLWILMVPAVGGYAVLHHVLFGVQRVNWMHYILSVAVLCFAFGEGQ